MIVLKNNKDKYFIGESKEFLQIKKTNKIYLHDKNKNLEVSSILVTKESKKEIIPFEFVVANSINIDSNIAVIKNNILFVLIEDRVYLISSKNFNIIKYVEINSVQDSHYESIVVFKDGFVVKGEKYIQYFDKDFNLKWHKGFRDIIHTPYNDENDFFILEDKICLYDFKEYYYEIDVDGNIIKEIPPHDFMSD